MRHLLALVLAFASSAFAQTDITSRYLLNPSFEQDDISSLPRDNTRGAYTAATLVGWQLTGSYGVSDIMTAAATATDNNFGVPGTPSDGTQMYYIRHAWVAASANLLQSITLPAGKYRLQADNKCVTQSNHQAALVAGSRQASLTFLPAMPNAWTTTSVDFELDKETTLNLGLHVDFGGGSGASVLLDNFRLLHLPEDYVEPQDPTEESVDSPTEGVITHDFVPEHEMMQGLLVMLARFSQYMQNDFFDCQYPNSVNEACGYFNGESSGQANEAGVRTNADLGMLCAFLVKYAKPAGVALPTGVTWERIEDMARKSLVFAYSTHKANKLKVCAGSVPYWGSTSVADHVWESSLWAMSVAYSAYFQWEQLSEQQRKYIYNVLKAECDYELERTIPTGYAGDTKAEENGWEADVLAAALGLFPDDPLADRWFRRLREFAVNSYSHYADATDQSVLDPHYDNTTVAQLFRGNNLYPDYTLQNHNLFHTSYQNVVMQELGEAALALQLFQGESPKWRTNALMHNNRAVTDSVLNWLALSDGELAMPNGNDWSLFLYDQITSYTTQACFQRDPNALMLENLAYKYIRARQQTTPDGSWLLRPDVSARRMGVQGHRVMMTYLMHLHNSTADLVPATWSDFRQRYAEARVLPNQNVVRAFTRDRFTTFSWSTGLKSYTGYFASNTPDRNKIVVPYRANNTGNLLGWYTVSGKGTNASPVVQGIYELNGTAYTMNGELNTNDNALNNRFALFSTPGNALIYLDDVRANSNVTVTGEYIGMLAVSTDELMKERRTLYYEANGQVAHKQTDGSTLFTAQSAWSNIDNALGVVGLNDKATAFGHRSANNSIFTSKLYPLYANAQRSVSAGETVDAHNLVYYSSVSALQTRQLHSQLVSLRTQLPAGWNGVIAADPDSTRYLFVSNFRGTDKVAALNGLQFSGAAPVLKQLTSITDSKARVSIALQANHSTGQPLRFYVKGTDLEARQLSDSTIFLHAKKEGKATVLCGQASEPLSLRAEETVKITLNADGSLSTETYVAPAQEETEVLIINPGFREGTYGWQGAPTVRAHAAEKYNTGFDVFQELTGLRPGDYELSVQGFYRQGTTAHAAAAYQGGSEQLHAVLYAVQAGRTFSQPIASIFSEAGRLGTVGTLSTHGYVPNTMEDAAIYFMKGCYPNTLRLRVGEDGSLRIGVRKTQLVGSDWAIFSNFRLRYLGPTDGVLGVNAQKKHGKGTFTLGGARVGDSAAHPLGVLIMDGKKVVR